MQENKALTSLRGIFAMWVVFFHLRAWSSLSDTPFPIVDRGYLGVDFFFLLSGFILAMSYGATFSGLYRPAAHGWFLVKRFGRLFPLHLFMLLIACVVVRLSGQSQYWWRHIAIEAALMHRWSFIHTPKGALNGPDWSISCEWAASILFPAFIYASGIYAKRSWRLPMAALLSIVALVYLSIEHGTMDIGEANSYLPLLRCFSEFMLGIILFGRRDHFERLKSYTFVGILLSTLSLGFLLRQDLIFILVMIVALPVIAANDRLFNRMLSCDPFYWLGRISYSIYLVQTPVMLAIDYTFANSKYYELAHWVTTPLLIILFAKGTNLVVEKRGSRWIDELIRPV